MSLKVFGISHVFFVWFHGLVFEAQSAEQAPLLVASGNGRPYIVKSSFFLN